MSLRLFPCWLRYCTAHRAACIVRLVPAVRLPDGKRRLSLPSRSPAASLHASFPSFPPFPKTPPASALAAVPTTPSTTTPYAPSEPQVA